VVSEAALRGCFRELNHRLGWILSIIREDFQLPFEPRYTPSRPIPRAGL
jgi:hypothetical protein